MGETSYAGTTKTSTAEFSNGRAEPNIYTTIIIDEARRRGISVDLRDPETGEMVLTCGDRPVRTIQSLSELTTAVAYLNRNDKIRSRRVLEGVGLNIPDGRLSTSDHGDLDFVRRHGSVVVKPAVGEGGEGVTVGVTDTNLDAARTMAARYSDRVLLEEKCDGQDLRVLVIAGAVVAAAVRQPPSVSGDGERTVSELIKHDADESGPLPVGVDGATKAHLGRTGWALDEIPEPDEEVELRGTANVHTGGSIHDVTDRLHPQLRQVAIEAAAAIGIPVAGVDLIVPSVEGSEHAIIEINEQPGLANHEPRPTAQRFLDLLFPETAD